MMVDHYKYVQTTDEDGNVIVPLLKKALMEEADVELQKIETFDPKTGELGEVYTLDGVRFGISWYSGKVIVMVDKYSNFEKLSKIVKVLIRFKFKYQKLVEYDYF